MLKQLPLFTSHEKRPQGPCVWLLAVFIFPQLSPVTTVGKKVDKKQNKL